MMQISALRGLTFELMSAWRYDVLFEALAKDRANTEVWKYAFLDFDIMHAHWLKKKTLFLLGWTFSESDWVDFKRFDEYTQNIL